MSSAQQRAAAAAEQVLRLQGELETAHLAAQRAQSIVASLDAA